MGVIDCCYFGMGFYKFLNSFIFIYFLCIDLKIVEIVDKIYREL
jgi:hypothetical protein